jgi:hypothetical protein
VEELGSDYSLGKHFAKNIVLMKALFRHTQQMISRKFKDNDSFKTRKGKIGVYYIDHLSFSDIA